jgi:hypothetical protein
MSISDDVPAHLQRCNDYLRPYTNAHGLSLRDARWDSGNLTATIQLFLLSSMARRQVLPHHGLRRAVSCSRSGRPSLSPMAGSAKPGHGSISSACRACIGSSWPPSPTTTQHSLPGGPLRPYLGRTLTGWIAPAWPGAHNILTQCGPTANPYDTDGNGIIIDTFNGAGVDNVLYPHRILVATK